MGSGWSIRSYVDDEAIPLYVNKVYSDNTQLQYAYYDLPFVCPPSGRKHAGYASGRSVSLNLGEVLRGDRIMTSDYDLVMGQDQECQYLCSPVVDRRGIKRAQKLVEDGYVVDWIVDNLPGATSFVTADKSRRYYAAGFKLGYKDFSSVTGKPRYFINNHLTLVIRWRPAPGRAGDNGGKVIVGFEVYTRSLEAGHRASTGCPQDLHAESNGMELYIAPNVTSLASKYPSSSYLPPEDDVDDGATVTIPYTYSVYFREDDGIEWRNRWDLYFNNQEESSSIHWLAILNSLVILGLLTGVVVMILNRTVSGDGKTYAKDGSVEDGMMKSKRKKPRNGAKSPRLAEKSPAGLLDQGLDGINEIEISSDEESVEETTGWKLLHGDVFRSPRHAIFLAPLVGSGMQLIFMTTGLLVLSCSGLLNPSWRGGFASVGMGLFVFAGIFSGYYSSRVYKTFGGLNWRNNTLMVSCTIPGFSCSGIFADKVLDCASLPWLTFQHHLLAQSHRMVPSIQHGPSLLHPRIAACSLAINPAPTRLRRQLVRPPQQPTIRAPYKNYQHPTANPTTAMVYKIHLQHPPSGSRPICSHLHRTTLRLSESLARQERVLLRLWILERRQPSVPYYRD